MSSNPRFPPLDGGLLLSDLINFHIEQNPSFPIFVYPDETKPEGVSRITFLEFGRAAHRIAHVVRPGRQGSEGQIVMLIANADTILHHSVVSGMSIAGLIPFLVSPRNSSAAIADMIKRTSCSRIMTMYHAHGSLIDAVRREVANVHLTVDELPTLTDAFPNLGHEVESDPFTPYPPPASRPDLDKPAIYLHSSGTTGFPKPIAHSYKVQVHWMTQPGTYEYRTMSAPRRLGVMSLPPFHNYGLVFQLYVPIACLITAVVYPPSSAASQLSQPVIPTTDNILACVRQTNCNILMTVPTFLEQWATSETAIEELKRLELVLYGGGPLPVKIGDALCAAGVPVGVEYGGTEFGCPVGIPDKKDIAEGDWLWMRFSDEVKVRWVPQGDDTFECQILSTESNQLAVENLPDVKGYATSDVFIKHPTKNLWKIVGRTDDVITLASGEKAVPAPMESIIGSSSILQGVVMFGRERNQVGVLVEPRQEYAISAMDENAVAEFRNKIWPLVEEANKTSPAFSRVFKEMILITTNDKPMARAGKGTVQKKATLKAYESEIDALYDTVEASFRPSNGFSSPLTWDGHELETWLTDNGCALGPGQQIDPNLDLFAQGFDSLSATYLRNQILGALRNSQDSYVQEVASRIPHNLVFDSPTIKLLAAQLAAFVQRSETTESRKQHIAAMNDMIDKYSVALNGIELGTFEERGEPAVVLLTGSTGGLGSFLLAQLLENQAVARVYALNRSSSSSLIKDRQHSAFADKGLPIELLDSVKLVYVESDASQDKCGLPTPLYNEIRDRVTVIIHNAWRVDFNLPLTSFEPNIQATRNLVDLGLDSTHRQRFRFVFTSSVGSASSWNLAQGPFPEEVQLDPSFAVGSGYGESKYVAERIIVKSGLHATSLRVGQIAGGPNGSWATTDWLPIIVKSSITLGTFPEAHGVVSWMRADKVAAAVLEIALAEVVRPAALNLVNPRPVSWNDIMTAVRNSIVDSGPSTCSELPFVPFQDWFALLEKRAEVASPDDLRNIPAIKLLEFIRAMAEGDLISRRSGTEDTEAGGITKLSIVKSLAVSNVMLHMSPLGEVEASAWVRYWKSKGLF